MKRLHVVGRKNHGKTTLVTELTEALTKEGFRVGTLKHTHHQHELDTPGKDSHRHRQAGAARVGIISPGLNAMFWAEPNLAGDDRYAAFTESFSDCDFVIVEGDTQTTADKIEVWRAELGSKCLAETDSSIHLVVTDDSCPADCQQTPRESLTECLAWIRRRFSNSS